MHLRPAALLLLMLSFSLPSVNGQTELYTGVAFEHEVTPTWGYEFEVEHRREVSTGEQNRFLLTAAVNRLLVNRLSVTPGIRVTPHYDGRPTTLRLFTDLNFSYPLWEGPFALEGRLRSQYETEFTETDSQAEIAVRPRLGVVYTFHRTTDLVAEVETRYRFDAVDAISQMRYTLGLSTDISTRVNVEMFIRREAERFPESTFTVGGILLNYVLPDRRHRDWKYRRPFGRSLLW